MQTLNQSKSVSPAVRLTRRVAGRLAWRRPSRERRESKLPAGRALAVALAAIFFLAGSARVGYAEESSPSLLTMIGQWRYPESEISGAMLSDAATVNTAGDRMIPSIQYKAVLTTKDSVEKVLAYYKAKLTPATGPDAAKANKDGAVQSGRSVTFQDDSEGRPLVIHVVLVNTADSSTTLVISRATTESATHIAWTRYQRL